MNGLPNSSGIMNSNRFQPSNFKNLYLSVYSSDLSDLWLVGKLLKVATSFMLRSKSECTFVEEEFSIKRKPGVFANQA